MQAPVPVALILIGCLQDGIGGFHICLCQGVDSSIHVLLLLYAHTKQFPAFFLMPAPLPAAWHGEGAGSVSPATPAPQSPPKGTRSWPPGQWIAAAGPSGPAPPEWS